MKANPAYIEEVKEVVRKSPFPEHMAMRLTEMDFDMADVEIELGKSHLQPFGLVHGGVIATAIDTATFWAVFMRIPEDAGLVNIDLKLNYLRSITKGILRAEGRTIRSGNSICYSEAKVYDQDRELIAHGTSSMMILPGKGLELRTEKFLDY